MSKLTLLSKSYPVFAAIGAVATLSTVLNGLGLLMQSSSAQEMDRISQSNAAAAEQVLATTNPMTGAVDDVGKHTGKFTLDRQAEPASRRKLAA